MLKHQTLSIELSELRSKINQMFLDGHDPNDAEQAKTIKELREQIATKETEYRAALEAEPEPEKRIDEGETNELRSMLGRTNIVAFFDDVLGNGSADDRKLVDEIRSATGVQNGYIPVDVIWPEQRAVKTDNTEEHRVTSGPTNTPNQARPFLPYMFPNSSGEYLGVSSEVVQPGSAEFPRISAKVASARASAGALVTSSDITFGSVGLSANRFGSNVTYRTEERLRWPGFSEAIAEHVRSALADAYDIFILRGATDGFENTTALTTTTASAEFTYSNYLALYGSAVDGRYASEASDVRILGHPDSYAHALGVVNSAGESALEGARRIGGGFRASANLSAKASSKVKAIIAKGTGRRNAVSAIWRGVEVLEDRISRGNYGETTLITNMFADFAISDPGGYARVEIHVG